MKLDESTRRKEAFGEDRFHSGVEYKTLKNFCLTKNTERTEMDSTCGFRLDVSSTKDSYDDGTMSISSYSTSKQRIDAMFDDSRSILSDCSKRLSFRNHKNINLSLSRGSQVTNNIEERIKKMFEEISINDWRDSEDPAFTRGYSEESLTTFNSSEKQVFAVTYLGSKPIHEKSVNLRSIQDPLKDLYFNYKKSMCKDEVNFLTIAKEGLKIKFQDKEELHTFNTIAVWASVKLSFRRTCNAMEFAFIPIVIDPEGVDKNSLFRELKNEDKYERLRNFQIQNEGTHYPIFAVVMKNLNMNKQLECHGFICKSSEEAIIIAANLYRALVKKMKRKKEVKTVNGGENKEKEFCKDDMAKSSEPKVNENSKENKGEKMENSKAGEGKLTESVLPAISESPQLNSLCSTATCKNEFPTPLNGNQKKSEEEHLSESENERKISERRGSAPENIYGLEMKNSGKILRRTESDKGVGVAINDHYREGDVLTKVIIPRSSSFLNANGPLSRFPRCQTSNTKNNSPLGFKELFNEFHLHEGLENMDDILNVIIDAEGMSFNELKPIYKEFLMKLAVTLTKDELYQRSKVIMRRQKKRNQSCAFKKRKFISHIGLENIFKRSVVDKSRTKKKTRSSELEFTSVVFHSSNKHFLPNLSSVKLLPYRTKRNQKLRRKLTKRLTKSGKKQRITSSKANNFLQFKSRFCLKEKKSASCFSCSGGTYNSENCTCSSVDTCSCMMDVHHLDKSSQQYSTESLTRAESRRMDDSVKTCSCDSESCTESGKCYCATKDNRNLLDINLPLKNTVNSSSFRSADNARFGSISSFRKGNSQIQKDPSFSKTKEQVLSWSKSNLLHLSNSSCVSKTHKTLSDVIYSQNKSSHQSKEKIHPHSISCSDADDQHLKEIQNTIIMRGLRDPKLTTQNIWLPNDRIKKLIQNADHHSASSLTCGSKRHSSLRCRTELLAPLTNMDRSNSCKSKLLLGSLRHCEHKFQSHVRPRFGDLANSSLRFTKRMDVYNSNNSEKTIPDNRSFCNYHPGEFTGPKCEVHNYNVSRADGIGYSKEKYKNVCGTVSEHSNSPFRVNKKKVLVVSARDSKGKVVYMGTSNKCETPVKNSNNQAESNLKAENEALAIKKSAEIAALFCEISTKSKLSYFNSLKEQNKNIHWSLSNSFKDSNLENTLGYFP